MADHDQRFKNLLQEFFAEFVQLFFPDWAGRFDFAGLEWLNAEVFPDKAEVRVRCIASMMRHSAGSNTYVIHFRDRLGRRLGAA